MIFPSRATRTLIVCVATFGIAPSTYADDAQAVMQAKWRPLEIKYSYTGFTTAYDCLAFESKMKRILRTLGAHPQTKVRAQGCTINRPSRNFFVTITTATPIPAAQDDAPRQDKSRQELLDRLGAQPELNEQFPAAWKRVDLSDNRALDLQPGDCELMEGLRDHVLPKLNIEVVQDRVVCTPRQVSIDTPKLEVSALVPVKSADAS